MNSMLLIGVVLIVASTVVMFRLRRRIIVGFVSASIGAGVLYWLVEFSPYLLAAASRKRLPLDALVLLIPFVGFALVFSCMITPIVIYSLQRLRFFNAPVILIGATLEGAVISSLIRDEFTLWRLALGAAVGLLSGVLFVLLVKNELRSGPPAAA